MPIADSDLKVILVYSCVKSPSEVFRTYSICETFYACTQDFLRQINLTPKLTPCDIGGFRRYCSLSDIVCVIG